MSQVFGKKDTVAKSWSEMWEEDEEEEQFEHGQPSPAPVPAKITRTWSHESVRKPSTVSNVLREKKSCSALMNARNPKPRTYSPQKPSYSPNENDPIGWRSTKRSPKQIPADKWAALGDRRRNPNTPLESITFTKKRSMTTTSRKRSGSNTYDNYPWNRRGSRSKAHPAHYDNDWRQHRTVDSSPDDAEWVGGWHNFHL